MDNPNSYSYQTDTVNFGKQIGEYFFAILSHQNDDLLVTDNTSKGVSANQDTQLTNLTKQSIIGTD